MYKKFDVRKYNSKNKRYFQDGGEVYYEDCDCHNNDLPTYAKGGQVWQKWKRATGLPWREARTMGLTDGSYDANVRLEGLIDTGRVNDYLHARSKQGTKTKPVPKKSSNTKSQKSLTQRAKEAGFDTLGQNINFNNRNVTGVNFNPMNLPGTKSQPTTTSTTPQKSLSERFGANMPQVGVFDNTFGIGSFGGYDTGATRELASQSGVSGAKGKTVVPTRESLSLTSQPPSQKGRWTQADLSGMMSQNVIEQFTKPHPFENLTNEDAIHTYHKTFPSKSPYVVINKSNGSLGVYNNGQLLTEEKVITGRHRGDGDYNLGTGENAYNIRTARGQNVTGAGIFNVRRTYLYPGHRNPETEQLYQDRPEGYKGFYSREPIFHLSRQDGTASSMAIHAPANENRVDAVRNTNIKYLSAGCTSGDVGMCKRLKEEYNINLGDRVYVIPEEKGNKITLSPKDSVLRYEVLPANIDRYTRRGGFSNATTEKDVEKELTERRKAEQKRKEAQKKKVQKQQPLSFWDFFGLN